MYGIIVGEKPNQNHKRCHIHEKFIFIWPIFIANSFFMYCKLLTVRQNHIPLRLMFYTWNPVVILLLFMEYVKYVNGRMRNCSKSPWQVMMMTIFRMCVRVCVCVCVFFFIFSNFSFYPSLFNFVFFCCFLLYIELDRWK